MNKAWYTEILSWLVLKSLIFDQEKVQSILHDRCSNEYEQNYHQKHQSALKCKWILQRIHQYDYDFLINLFSKYNQITLTKIYQNLIMFMTSLKLLRQMTLSQDVINFVTQFIRVIIKILKNLLEICKSFLNDIEVKRLKTIYNNAKITSEVHLFMLKYIKNLDFILLNFEFIDCIIFDEKS